MKNTMQWSAPKLTRPGTTIVEQKGSQEDMKNKLTITWVSRF
jgi:hypothetical protein